MMYLTRQAHRSLGEDPGGPEDEQPRSPPPDTTAPHQQSREHHVTNNDSTADAVGVVKAYMQALQAGDKDTILRLYADDPEIIP